MADTFPVTDRTRMRRKASRATYDRATLYAILDEALIATVAAVIDGKPELQPMIHVRLGDRIILHGLATNRMLGALAAGAEACINVTHLDALALARRIEDHSMHYRSVTLYGHASVIDDAAEKERVMHRVFESLVGSGRLPQLPPLPAGYLKGTMVLSVAIEQAVGKVNDAVDTGDGPDSVWSGLLPVRLAFGPPVPDGRTAAEGLETPPDLATYRRGA